MICLHEQSYLSCYIIIIIFSRDFSHKIKTTLLF
nr:MAG TPA: hypothetical protein [Caudoviricetes sp.]